MGEHSGLGFESAMRRIYSRANELFAPKCITDLHLFSNEPVTFHPTSSASLSTARSLVDRLAFT